MAVEHDHDHVAVTIILLGRAGAQALVENEMETVLQASDSLHPSGLQSCLLALLHYQMFVLAIMRYQRYVSN